MEGETKKEQKSLSKSKNNFFPDSYQVLFFFSFKLEIILVLTLWLLFLL